MNCNLATVDVEPKGGAATNMKTKPLRADVDRLLSLSESIATVLSEKSNELGISRDVAALKRQHCGNLYIASTST